LVQFDEPPEGQTVTAQAEAGDSSPIIAISRIAPNPARLPQESIRRQ
jgi:hypothetical protein